MKVPKPLFGFLPNDKKVDWQKIFFHLFFDFFNQDVTKMPILPLNELFKASFCDSELDNYVLIHLVKEHVVVGSGSKAQVTVWDIA